MAEANVMRQFSETAGFERYRLAVISTWPDSEATRAALQSARAALEREAAFASLETERGARGPATEFRTSL
jgi:hypothetical protein